MQQKSKASFAIIRYNLRTYEPGGVVAVLRGRIQAEGTLREMESGQSSEDRYAGWGYILEQTTLRPGMDPEKATALRQTRLDVRESAAREQVATHE